MLVKLFGLVPVVTSAPWSGVKVQKDSPIMGIELELENIPDWRDWVQTGFDRKEDGSLRNRGSEFISAPMPVEQLIKSVENFFQANKVNASHISERCSVHVHLNCQNMTLVQLTTLCKVYQVVERVLFNFVGEDRDKGIFCVPWYETNITANNMFKEPINPGNFKRWLKYTALNLLPLFSYGTVEFRHLGGQSDVKRVVQWILLIKALHTFSMEADPKEVDNILLGLNTTSQYDMLIDRVFKEHASILKTDGYKEALENGVLALKYMLFDNFMPPQEKSLLNARKIFYDESATFTNVPIPVTDELPQEVPPVWTLPEAPAPEQRAFNELINQARANMLRAARPARGPREG